MELRKLVNRRQQDNKEKYGIFGKEIDINVIQNPLYSSTVFNGGSMLASSDNFHKKGFYFTREDY